MDSLVNEPKGEGLVERLRYLVDLISGNLRTQRKGKYNKNSFNKVLKEYRITVS